MNLKIRATRDVGVKEDERLVIEVLNDDDVGNYLVFDSESYKEGVVSSRPKHVYWFPDEKVKAGDLVVLYTKNGTRNQRQNKDGSTSHFFYWGIENILWTQPTNAVVLLEAKSWDFEKALKQ